MFHEVSLQEEISKALETVTMFKIGDGDFWVFKESIVTLWIVSAIIIVFVIIATRNLKVKNPGKVQLAIELLLEKGLGFFEGLVGKGGRIYLPYLMCLITFIGVADVLPIFGFKPPMKDVSVTIGLAVMSIVVVQYAAIRQKGVKKWLKSFTKPVGIVTPLKILELFIKPFSLCMRLMGNMIGAFAIMKMIEYACPVVVPAFASLYFDLFDGLLQAFVFAFLTALYIGEAVEEDEEEEKEVTKTETIKSETTNNIKEGEKLCHL